MSTIHPTPSGTRDVLPDELREVHAIAEGMRRVFGEHGYGEIRTPALEYEEVLTRGDPAAADPAYKLFDEQGNVLVLRSWRDSCGEAAAARSIALTTSGSESLGALPMTSPVYG